MTRVNTALGEGRIVESSSQRGRTMHLVEGNGFSKWFTANEVFEMDETERSKAENFNEENNTRLPYNPNPQHTNFTLPDESTLQPVYEIDSDERTEDEDSLDVERIAEKLGPKFVKLKADRLDRDSGTGRMVSDPERYAREIRASFAPVDESNQKMADLFYLMDTDPMVKQAAWMDVQKKAVRLRKSGNIDIQEITPRAIHAVVVGDNGTYDTVVVRGGAVVGSGSISEWACECEWGRWAFVRKHTYVGRLCSHAYAAYMELQSKTKADFDSEVSKSRKDKKNQPALLPFRNSSTETETVGLLGSFYEWADDWANPIELEEFISEKNLDRRSAEEIYRHVENLIEYIQAGGDDVEEFIQSLDTGHRNASLNVEESNYYPETHFVDEVDVEEDERPWADFDHTDEDDEYKVAHVDPDTGYKTHVFTNSDGTEVCVVYDPLDRIVDEVAPANGSTFTRGEEEGVLNDFVNGLSDEEAYGKDHDLLSREARFPSEVGVDLEDHKPFSGSGWRPTIIPETSKQRSEREDEMEDVTELSDEDRKRLALRKANLKMAGRVFSFQEQMDLINEAPGDDDILGRLDLRGTHYEH